MFKKFFVLSGIFTLLISISPTSVEAGSVKERREAALRLFAVGLLIPGAAAYCIKYHGIPAAWADDIERWNATNNGIFLKGVEVIKETGGLTEKQKADIDKYAFVHVKKMVSSGDPRVNCTVLFSQVKNGLFALDRPPYLKDVDILMND